MGDFRYGTSRCQRDSIWRLYRCDYCSTFGGRVWLEKYKSEINVDQYFDLLFYKQSHYVQSACKFTVTLCMEKVILYVMGFRKRLLRRALGSSREKRQEDT